MAGATYFISYWVKVGIYTKLTNVLHYSAVFIETGAFFLNYSFYGIYWVDEAMY